MAKNWIKGAIKHKGSLTKKAKSAHETTEEFVSDVLSGEKKATTQTKQQANLAKTLKKLRK